MEAAFSAIEVVGGFVGRDLVLVREWHSYADAMWIFALRFDGEFRTRILPCSALAFSLGEPS
jgi:hypothetical protein